MKALSAGLEPATYLSLQSTNPFISMRHLASTCIKNLYSAPPHRASLCSSTHLQISTPHQFILLLNRSTSLKQVKEMQALITTSGLHQNPYIIGKLVEITSVKLLNMTHAMLLFTHSDNPNPFTWNTIIRGFSISKNPHNALHVHILMQRKAVETESYTYAFVFKACARAQALQYTRALQAIVVKWGHESHVFVSNTMIHASFACGDVIAACKVFDVMGSTKNIVTWNAMIAGYVQNDLPQDGLRMFDQMWSLGLRPDDATIVSVLSACGQIRELDLGRQIHAYLDENKVEFESSVKVQTALLDMYAKCRSMGIARLVFNKITRRDIGMWNALIGGYVSLGLFGEALEVFGELQGAGLDPDEPTLVSTLQACAQLGALDMGKKIHVYAEEKGLICNTTLETALVQLYSKCGCIAEAQEIFNKMSRKDVMAWTSMIVGLAVHGHAKDALDLFSLMQKSGPKPDGITFVGVLCACSHAGLVDEGLSYFESMIKEYCIVPKIQHYGCIVDLLGRAGRLKEAFNVISSMDVKQSEVIWRTLLSACKTWSNIELAEIAVTKLLELKCDHCADYVLLSNIYASNGRWDDVEKIRTKMEEGGEAKIPGLSLIESDSKICHLR